MLQHSDIDCFVSAFHWNFYGYYVIARFLSKSSVGNFAEIVLLLLVCFSLFCLAIITTSRIPGVMEKTRLKYKIMYYKELAKCFSNNDCSKENLRLLKALREINVFHLTTCNTLQMNKTLIVSS